MNIQDYVLQELTYKLLSETVKEPSLKINERLGELAIAILKEKNEESKQYLIEEYEKLNKLNNLDIHNFNEEDLDYRARKVLTEKIDRMVWTILHPTVK